MKSTALLLPALLLILVPRAAAQEPEAPTAEELAKRQKELRVRYERLEETMKRIASIIAQDDPEKAARLEMAWRRSKLEDENARRIEAIETFLRQQYFQQALNEQKELDRALDELLDILLDRQDDRKEIAEEIDRMEQLSEALRNLIEQERSQFHKSEQFADPEKSLQRAAAAKARLDDLIRRQQELIESTTREPGAPDELKALQRRLAELRTPEEMKAFAEDVARFAQRLPAAAREAAAGGKDPATRAQEAAERAAEAEDPAADIREAADALRALEERLREGADDVLADEQERIRKDVARLQEELNRLGQAAPATPSGGESLEQAQGSMRDAGRELSRGERAKALPPERAAKEALERARRQVEELETEMKRLLQLPDYEKLAEEQDATEQDTGELLEKMRREGGPPTPGQGEVDRAKKAMQRASRNLRSRSARGANSDQREALERLEKAQKELEEALRQLREEQQLLLLEALERRMLRMLQKQEQLFKDTVALDLKIKDSGEPTRGDVERCSQLGDGEAELSTEAEKVLEILHEEGSTVVIPDVLEALREDLSMLAARLRGGDPGTYTQAVQQDVIATLRQLIVVIQEEQNRRSGQGGQGGEGMEDAPEDNLLPTSAELKMLRELQVRVNKRTEMFERLKEKDGEERDRLAKKQESVGELTRTMADALNRAEGE